MILAASTWKVSSTRDWRASIQNGYWGVKLLAWTAIAVLSFFIPNEFFTGWATFIDMPGAGLFIFIQVILLIDFAHTLSETLLGMCILACIKRHYVSNETHPDFKFS